MEWLARFKDYTVGLDTAPLIYFIEQNPRYVGMMRHFFQQLEAGRFQAVTSTLTLTEVLVLPIRSNNVSLAQQYREILLGQEGLTILSVSPEIAILAAELRASKNLRTPDSIQLATAIQGGANFFLTNDLQLKTTSSCDLEVIVLEELREL